jgi:hypothetical protein
MRERFLSAGDSLHAFAKDRNRITFLGDSVGVFRGDVLKQGKGDGGVSSSSSLQAHIGIEHVQPCRYVWHTVTSRREMRKLIDSGASRLIVGFGRQGVGLALVMGHSCRRG